MPGRGLWSLLYPPPPRPWVIGAGGRLRGLFSRVTDEDVRLREFRGLPQSLFIGFMLPSGWDWAGPAVGRNWVAISPQNLKGGKRRGPQRGVQLLPPK